MTNIQMESKEKSTEEVLGDLIVSIEGTIEKIEKEGQNSNTIEIKAGFNEKKKVNINSFYIGTLNGIRHYMVEDKHYRLMNGKLEEFKTDSDPYSGIYVAESVSEKEIAEILKGRL